MPVLTGNDCNVKKVSNRETSRQNFIAKFKSNRDLKWEETMFFLGQKNSRYFFDRKPKEDDKKTPAASTLQSVVASAVAHSATSTLQSAAASAVAHSAATSDGFNMKPLLQRRRFDLK